MKTIQLSQGKQVTVDDADYAQLSAQRWFTVKQIRKNRTLFYAARSGKPHILMHRQILGITDPEIKVDHKDGDGLNNQKLNLRTATHGQNIQNQRKTANCTSRFKGVSFVKSRNKWRAQITANGKRIFLGLYTNEEEAAAVYDQAARRYHLEFALPNSS